MTTNSEPNDGNNQALTWLGHMSDCLVWKVVGPPLDNPYAPKIPYKTLLAMANDRLVLKRHVQLRCLADGFEVMLIKNFAALDIETNHPCLVRLTATELIEYLERTGVRAEIESSMDAIQEQVKERVACMASNEESAARPRAKTPAAPKEKEKQRTTARIVRR